MDLAVQVRRWATALILLGVLVPIVVWGGQWVFLALICLVVVLCQLEYERLSKTKQGAVPRLIGILLALSMPISAMVWGERGLMMALVFCVLTWLVSEMAFRKQLAGVFPQIGARVLGYFSGALLPSYFVLLWKVPQGVHWLFWTASITAVGDTAAYYIGSLRGKMKLAPRISPGKTVEGAIAGLIGSVAGAMAYGVIFFPARVALSGFILAFIVGGAGQLGDLCESMLKRAVGLKDSGGLLPGHGGILDRLDSLLFAVPIVFYWATW